MARLDSLLIAALICKLITDSRFFAERCRTSRGREGDKIGKEGTKCVIQLSLIWGERERERRTLSRKEDEERVREKQEMLCKPGVFSKIWERASYIHKSLLY